MADDLIGVGAEKYKIHSLKSCYLTKQNTVAFLHNSANVEITVATNEAEIHIYIRDCPLDRNLYSVKIAVLLFPPIKEGRYCMRLGYMGWAEEGSACLYTPLLHR